MKKPTFTFGEGIKGSNIIPVGQPTPQATGPGSAAPSSRKKMLKRNKVVGKSMIVRGGASSAPSFDPPVTAGLVGHWVAGVLTAADGERLSTWRDRVNSIDITQPTGAKQPQYRSTLASLNNKPVVEFDDDEWMGVNYANIGALISTEVTVFAVLRLRAACQRIICMGKNGPDVGWSIHHGVGAGGMQSLVGANGGGSFAYRPGTVQTDRIGQSFISEYVHTAANANRVYVNGTQQGADGAAQEMNYVKGTQGGLCFGALYWTSHAGDPADGLTGTADFDLAELLIYGVELNAADRLAVRQYLGTKYNLAVI